MSRALRFVSDPFDFPIVVILVGLIAVVLVLWFPSVAIADNQIDLWYNFGLFFNYPEAIHWFTDSRQISRVPVVIPGYVLTHLFGILASSYILFFGYYFATLGFFYGAIRRLISREVAAFATIFLATNSYLIGAYSTTLANTPSVVYDVAALYFIAFAVTSANQTKGRLALLASGLMAGLAIHCHLVIVPYLAANLVIYSVWQLFFVPGAIVKRSTDLAIGVLLTFLGILVATVILGAIIALFFHASFLQILNDFAYVPAAAQGLAKYHTDDWYKSGAEAGMLLTAFFIAILNLVGIKLGAGPTNPELANRLLAVSAGILALCAALLAYNTLGGVFLQYSSYFTCFIPYLALVAFSPLAMKTGLERGPLAALLAFFCVASVAIVMIREGVAPGLYDFNFQARAALVCGLCITVLFVLLLVHSKQLGRMRPPLLAYIVAIVALSLISRPEEKVGAYIWIDSRETAMAQRSEYVRLERGLKFLTAQHFADYPKFWVDMGRIPETGIYPRTFMIYRYQPYFPSVNDDFCYAVALCRYEVGDNVVVISDPRDLAPRARAAFSGRGLRVKESASEIISYEGLSYELLVEHVIGRTDKH